MAKSSGLPVSLKKFSVAKTKKGVMNTLALIAGLFIGGLLEQYAMSKIAYLADTKADATDATKTNKNYVGIILKNAVYIIGGLGIGQMTSNEYAEYAGYGLASYGGLKIAKTVSEKAKVYSLGSVHQNQDVSYPQYQLNSSVAGVTSN